MTKGLAAASTGDAEARAREKLLQQKLGEQTQQFAELTKVPGTRCEMGLYEQDLDWTMILIPMTFL